MSNMTYYVSIAFERDEAGDLVAMEAVEARTPNAAVSLARLQRCVCS